MADLTMSEEEFETKLSDYMKAGESEGLKRAARKVMDRAVSQFERGGNDGFACILRDMALELTKLSEDARKK